MVRSRVKKGPLQGVSFPHTTYVGESFSCARRPGLAVKGLSVKAKSHRDKSKAPLKLTLAA